MRRVLERKGLGGEGRVPAKVRAHIEEDCSRQDESASTRLCQ